MMGHAKTTTDHYYYKEEIIASAERAGKLLPKTMEMVAKNKQLMKEWWKMSQNILINLRKLEPARFFEIHTKTNHCKVQLKNLPFQLESFFDKLSRFWNNHFWQHSFKHSQKIFDLEDSQLILKVFDTMIKKNPAVFWQHSFKHSQKIFDLEDSQLILKVFDTMIKKKPAV